MKSTTTPACLFCTRTVPYLPNFDPKACKRAAVPAASWSFTAKFYRKKATCIREPAFRPRLVPKIVGTKCHIRRLTRCREGFLDTNKKSNFTASLETTRRIF